MEATAELLASFEVMSLNTPRAMKAIEDSLADAEFDTDAIMISLVTKLYVNRDKWPEYLATETMRHLTYPEVSAYVTVYWEEPYVWMQFRVGVACKRVDFRKYIHKTKGIEMHDSGRILDLRSTLIPNVEDKIGGDLRLGVDVSLGDAAGLLEHFLTVSYT